MEWKKDQGLSTCLGCLQVLKGSHHLGRINHKSVGGQVGADLDRVEEAKKVSAV